MTRKKYEFKGNSNDTMGFLMNCIRAILSDETFERVYEEFKMNNPQSNFELKEVKK